MSAPPRLWTSLVPADTRVDPARVAVSAAGVRVTYADGCTRLCATSGLWNVPLGYGNEAVSDAVARATRDASYLSLFRTAHRLALDAADALVDLAGADRYERVVFSTSGGAANDAAMKLARQFWALRGETARTVVVGLRGSYHGTMYGSHALSGDDLLHSRYALDRRSIRHVAHDDGAEQLRLLLHREGHRIAAVVVEPLLGSGAIPLDTAFVEELVALREQYGFLLVADEVATGFGRTGPLFASGSWSAAPDVLVLSKALTNGATAASALLVGARIAREFVRARETFVHAETQAGTPAAAAAILAVVDQFHHTPVLSAAERLGERLRSLADALVRDGVAASWRGRGCFLALELRDAAAEPVRATDVAALVDAIAVAGAVVQPGPSAIQLIPAYTYDDGDLAALDDAVRRGALVWRERE